MALPPIERKALFKAQITRDRMTLDSAANEVCGVTWFHLSEGLESRRSLSVEVRQKFAAYLGLTVEQVFGEATGAAA